MASLAEQFWDARYPPRDPVDLSFKGKVVLVTGANRGLGFEAAVKYAQLGVSKLIIPVRSLDKGTKAKEAILDRTKCSTEIVVTKLDLGNFASVKECAQKVGEMAPRLDVVLLCAGIMNPAFVKGEEGYEESPQVNVLSIALLALLLLPRLKESADVAESNDYLPHMCFISSLASQCGNAEWIPEGQTLIDRINDESQFDHTRQDFLLKLAIKFFIDGLTEQCDRDGYEDKIVINSCCPRMCRTDLHHKYSLPIRMMLLPYKLICGRSAEQGGRTLVSATALGVESHGALWSNDELDPSVSCIPLPVLC
jgi:NAD(P)-dependent dehydrogenase (short-subunit alcohol dehydrogenase family)